MVREGFDRGNTGMGTLAATSKSSWCMHIEKDADPCSQARLQHTLLGGRPAGTPAGMPTGKRTGTQAGTSCLIHHAAASTLSCASGSC